LKFLALADGATQRA